MLNAQKNKQSVVKKTDWKSGKHSLETTQIKKEAEVIDYLSDIKPLEDDGVSDEIIAKHLSDRTANAMLCSNARTILQENLAVVQDPALNVRSGTLIQYYESMEDGEPKQLLAWFISHTFGAGIDVDTNQYPRSIQWSTVTAGMDAGLKFVAQSLIDSAGGQPDAGTVSADVVAARNQYEAEQAERKRQESIQSVQAEIENNWINPAISDGVSTAAQVREAIKSGL